LQQRLQLQENAIVTMAGNCLPAAHDRRVKKALFL